MAARSDSARNLLIYWMDATICLLLVVSVIFTVGEALAGRISIVRAAGVIVLSIAFYGLVPLLLRAGFDRGSGLGWRLVLGGMLSAALLVFAPIGMDTRSMWMDSTALWLSMAALHLRPRATLAVGAGTVLLVSAYVVYRTGNSWPGVLLGQAAMSAVVVGAMLLWRWLWWVIRDAHRSREARARLAVAEERLRFARDLHDLLGHSLSVITLKSELAAKLATKDAGRAAAEMSAVRELAGESLAEVQQAVHGYQALDLDEELAGVRAALAAAGAHCVVEASTGDLSPAARTLLAWAVREGGTNILKHSAATRCAITIDAGVLEMVNDGVDGTAATPGNGLRGLSERLVTAGGSFSAGPTGGGEFRLRAVVPG
ncbi:histidine kinase [Nonomuraea antimicrobica]|uniref:Histidine kinase n=1 Tax=Nonomuraea antimicrobica TaxID=561173 RepID=A0ABP7CGE2_9ACTN